MVSVPHRLLSLPYVEVLHESLDLVIVHKRLTAPMIERPSCLTMHALSLVSQGRQVVYDQAGSRIRVDAGEGGLMRRDLYTVTDLLAGGTGDFVATVVFFSDGLVRRALARSERGEAVRASAATGLRHLQAAPTFSTWPAHLAASARQLGPAADAAWFVEQAEAFLAASVPDLGVLLERPRRSLREFMRAHYDKPLSVEDYAYLTGRSARSFRRDFAARFGESPKRWLVARRLERARELLRAGDVDSVNAAASAVGYASTSHFIARYRERYGETPLKDRSVGRGNEVGAQHPRPLH